MEEVEKENRKIKDICHNCQSTIYENKIVYKSRSLNGIEEWVQCYWCLGEWQKESLEWNKKLIKWAFLSFLVIALLGCLLHLVA